MRTASFVAAFASCIAVATAKSVFVTPHQQYSSSVGVLGCKIDTNRAAYWPLPVDCNNVCVKVTYQGRHVTLLRVDVSGGAYDISYDAWNYLAVGFSAKEPGKNAGGKGLRADYEDVRGSDPECRKLMHTAGNKLAFSAQNSQNFITSCAPGTFVRDNKVEYNIGDAQCSVGKDEVCKLTEADRAAGLNQPACPGGLGTGGKMKSCLVKDVEYPTGKLVCAVPDGPTPPPSSKVPSINVDELGAPPAGGAPAGAPAPPAPAPAPAAPAPRPARR